MPKTLKPKSKAPRRAHYYPAAIRSKARKLARARKARMALRCEAMLAFDPASLCAQGSLVRFTGKE